MDETRSNPDPSGSGRSAGDPGHTPHQTEYTPGGASTPPGGETTGRGAGTASPADGPKRKRRGILWAVGAVVLAFLVGFGWQYYRAMTLEASLQETEQELAVERLRVNLAQATLAAHSDDYELARTEMSTFFNSAQDQMDELSPDMQQTLREILSMRDDVITGLSRANPEYAGVLYGFLDRFRDAAEEPDDPDATPEAADTGLVG